MEETSKENKIKNIKTYADDMSRVVSGNESGLIKKIIHSEEENQKIKENLSPESKKNKSFMIISLVLLLIAGFSIIAVILLRQQILTVSVAPQFEPLIFIDQNNMQDVSGLNKDKIAEITQNQIINSKIKTNKLEGIYFLENKKIINLRRFFALIKANIDLNKFTYVDNNFLFGSYNKNPFFLLKTRSFSDIFDGMHSWENKMFYDLHGFFNLPTNADTNYLLIKNFEDAIVNNKNARVLYNTDGSIAMMYVFADENSVIIANSEDTAREIMLRLAGSKIKK